jgi:lipopolysaccharide transport system ATP-binding protein
MGTITVSNVGKAYKQYPTRWSRLAEWLDPRNKPRHNLHWVLQDINFTVQPGEAVGIIGINGAGKSTLLKMITGTTQPTTGSIHMSGRVAALLELGMGFHPDFTGRQNAYMAGQLLGYSIEDITRLMPEIEAFAEIGEYIDQPVRVYSSGMQMRLAFSVATASRPDILIVDEALSVGDAYFQHKSFDRIREFNKQGTTLLIVSHDKQAIQSVCDRAILLDAGKLALEGGPEAVMDYYNAMLANHRPQAIQQTRTTDGRSQTTSGSGEATVSKIQLTDKEDNPLEVIDVGQTVKLSVEIQAHSDIEHLVFGYCIKDRLGQAIFGTNTALKELTLTNIERNSLFRLDIVFPANLGQGTYAISTALHSDNTHLSNNYEWKDLALIFNVVNITKQSFTGVAWIDPEIYICKI